MASKVAIIEDSQVNLENIYPEWGHGFTVDRNIYTKLMCGR